MDRPSGHILVAEDETMLTNSLKFILNAAGYKVTMAPNGRIALAYIQNSILEHSNIDLLVTDIAMPEMNGEELIAALRKQSLHIPVLVMTGYGDKELVVRLMRLGCQDFIDKPFEPEELEERAKMILLHSSQEVLERKRQEHLAYIGEKSRSLIHDLNNIIGGTLGYADIVMEEMEATHPAYPKIAKLLSTANLAAEVCKELLSIKQDSPANIRTTTEIGAITAKIAAVMATLAPDSIAIKTFLPDKPLWLSADAERIQQALLNLGINAIDAMGMHGTLTFTVTSTHVGGKARGSSNAVCITVADTGSGIAEERLGDLFNHEFTTKTHGNGIGLPTVKKIVEEHGGRIEVQSKRGEGTRFTLIFPIVKSKK
jgi:signal transduction histidine kinase